MKNLAQIRKSPIIALVGPTAVGKSALAFALAKEFDAEIVSADSRQVYRYLDIGTAKPSWEERQMVPHHVIDIVDPDDTYSVARFQQDAQRALEDIAARGKVIFVVGGTGYYLRALLDRITIPAVPPDPKLRARLEAELRAKGIDALLARLEALDPQTASRIDRANPRRIIRALEVIESAGAPIPPLRQDPLPALWLGLTMDRARLYEIANRRVEAQVAAGLIEETRRVLAMGYSLDLPALNSLAYREMGQYLRGKLTREEAIEAYKHSTHHLIRRQLTWFRADERIIWLDATHGLPVQEARERIVAYLDSEARLSAETAPL
jgi:tRNA dimethylallyltransferase